MNSDTLKGQWKQFAGAAKEHWAKLTDDDWLQVEGNAQNLAGRIQERYGIARDKAEEQIQTLMDRVKSKEAEIKEGPR